MSTITLGRPYPYTGTSASYVDPLTAMSRMASRAMHWYRTQLAMREMSRLEDHMLADLGVGRGEIERVVAMGR